MAHAKNRRFIFRANAIKFMLMQKIISNQNVKVTIFFLVSVLFLYVWMWGIRQVFPAQPPGQIEALYKGVALETNAWLEPWQRWDTPHYQAIAEHGYSAFDSALFTPPLYPLLIRLFSPLFNGNTLASGLFISGLAFWGFLIVLFHLASLEFQNEKDVWRIILYVSFFPTAFFFIAAYNESLFLWMVLLSFYSVRKKQWIWAGVFGGLAAFTRIAGALMIIPLTFAAWEAWKTGEKRGILSPVFAGLGITMYPLYVCWILNLPPTAILDALNKRGGETTFPGLNLIEAFKRITQGILWEENLTELSFSVFFLMLTIFVWKKLPRIYGIYSAALLFLFLTRFGSPQPLVGMARYGIEIFPAFFILGIWGRNAWANRIILYLFWLGWLFFSAQFAIWGWVG